MVQKLVASVVRALAACSFDLVVSFGLWYVQLDQALVRAHVKARLASYDHLGLSVWPRFFFFFGSGSPKKAIVGEFLRQID